MARSLTPFLLFQDGVAEEAMQLYVSVFPGSEIRRVDRYGPGEPGAAGSVKRAEIVVAGQRILCIDSPVTHEFGFTPSVSLFVECDTEEELRAAARRLLAHGSELMPIGSYGFSRLFVWISDRFGVSWQLNLT
jgi:predicted 3-demethylubiquinone-9 3-methyltransferase (glyoxalase superfamily)